MPAAKRRRICDDCICAERGPTRSECKARAVSDVTRRVRPLLACSFLWPSAELVLGKRAGVPSVVQHVAHPGAVVANAFLDETDRKHGMLSDHAQQLLGVPGQRRKPQAVLSDEVTKALVSCDANVVSAAPERKAQSDVRLDIATRANQKNDEAKLWNQLAPESVVLVHGGLDHFDLVGKVRTLRIKVSTRALPPFTSIPTVDAGEEASTRALEVKGAT
mmetsp:Transcript_1784/g.5579  ORF Transcript_1784/g.5579 Transcript_1784/m.5579 type:complete len:219 (+) Transcript_1784:225-881(+)